MKYNTGKREQILNFLSSNESQAFTLEDIAKEIAPDGSGKSTVYRIVSELVESSRVKRISDGKTRHCTYQYVDEDCKSHLHLKCRDCGKLIHLEGSISKSLYGEILKNDGFTLEYGCMLFGTCNSCSIQDGRISNSTNGKEKI